MMRVMLSKLALESLERLSVSDRERVARAIDRLSVEHETNAFGSDPLVSATTRRSYFRYRVSPNLQVVHSVDPAQSAIYVVDIATKASDLPGVRRQEEPVGKQAGAHDREYRNGQPAWMRTVLFIGFVTFFVVIVACTIGMVYFGFGSPTPEERSLLVSAFFIEIGVAVIALFYAQFGLIRKPGDRDDAVPVSDIGAHRQTAAGALWSRDMVRFELAPKETLTTIHNLLGRIRERVTDRVRRIHPGVNPSKFRVHVALPDYANCAVHGTYGLILPDQLHIGHSAHDDVGLTVLPGQGVAGRAYVTGVAQKAQVTVGSDGQPKWPDEFEYTDTYMRRMPNDIRWLIAIPLRVPIGENQSETLGVLGIEGLEQSLTDDQIDAVVGYVLADVMLVAALIGQLSRVRMAIVKQDAAWRPREVGTIRQDEGATQVGAPPVSRFGDERASQRERLTEVTFEHLTESEKKILVDAGFEEVRIIMESLDATERREVELKLAKEYLS